MGNGAEVPLPLLSVFEHVQIVTIGSVLSHLALLDLLINRLLGHEASGVPFSIGDIATLVYVGDLRGEGPSISVHGGGRGHASLPQTIPGDFR